MSSSSSSSSSSSTPSSSRRSRLSTDELIELNQLRHENQRLTQQLECLKELYADSVRRNANNDNNVNNGGGRTSSASSASSTSSTSDPNAGLVARVKALEQQLQTSKTVIEALKVEKVELELRNKKLQEMVTEMHHRHQQLKFRRCGPLNACTNHNNICQTLTSTILPTAASTLYSTMPSPILSQHPHNNHKYQFQYADFVNHQQQPHQQQPLQQQQQQQKHPTAAQEQVFVAYDYSDYHVNGNRSMENTRNQPLSPLDQVQGPEEDDDDDDASCNQGSDQLENDKENEAPSNTNYHGTYSISSSCSSSSSGISSSSSSNNNQNMIPCQTYRVSSSASSSSHSTALDLHKTTLATIDESADWTIMQHNNKFMFVRLRRETNNTKATAATAMSRGVGGSNNAKKSTKTSTTSHEQANHEIIDSTNHNLYTYFVAKVLAKKIDMTGRGYHVYRVQYYKKYCQLIEAPHAWTFTPYENKLVYEVDEESVIKILPCPTRRRGESIHFNDPFTGYKLG